MTRQEQTFSAYYASMTDAGLLSIAANRTSFIEVAQKALDQELAKRSLTVPPEALRGGIVQFERPASSVFSGYPIKQLTELLPHKWAAVCP